MLSKHANELALDTRVRSIDKIRPGLKLTELNDFAGRNLADGLNDQGILKYSIFEALEKKLLMHVGAVLVPVLMITFWSRQRGAATS